MAGKTLLRARKHHIGAELLHVELVGNECANSVNKQSYAARPAEIGNDDESLAEYRDKMLIEMLKLHKKL